MAFVAQSRIIENLKGSSVWRAIVQGFSEFLKLFPSVTYCIFSIVENYDNTEEYLIKVEEATKGKYDALIIPMTPKEGRHGKKFLSLLKKHKGLIIAVNVPPDENALCELEGKLRGYVGMHEKAAGIKAAQCLFLSGKKFDCIYVPVDKPDHYGYSLRIQGIKEVAEMHNIPVCQININNPKEANIICQLMDSSAIVTLGPIGTDFALEKQKTYPEICAIVTMDLDQKTAEAIRSRKVICTLIQHPKEQGAKAAELALNLLNGTTTSAYTEIYCGPTIVDLDNISIFE